MEEDIDIYNCNDTDADIDLNEFNYDQIWENQKQ